MEINIEVNGMHVPAEKGETLLSVLKRHGFRVPTLCSMEGLSPSGACRLCVVEIGGVDRLVPSCSYSIEGPVSVTTHSPRVLRARKTNVKLLLSNHPDDCLYCERNGTCELQNLAEDLNIRERKLPGTKRKLPVDRSGPAVVRDPSKCILCGRCVRVCEEIMHTSTFDFAYRGNELRISTTLGQPIQFTNCTSCGQCVVSCPTGALTEKGGMDQLLEHLDHPGRKVVVQYTPAAAVMISYALGIRPGREMPDLFRALLYRCGFDEVFETTTGNILVAMELARLLDKRDRKGGSLPLITSSCPAWIRYLEQTDPELMAATAPLRTPQQIMGRLIRAHLWPEEPQQATSVVSVLITSCTAAKHEAAQEAHQVQGKPVIDLVLSAREVLRLVGMMGIDIRTVDPESSRIPLLPEGAAGRLTALSGGEAEAVARLFYRMKTGKHLNIRKFHRFRMHMPYREMTLEWGNSELRIGAVSGLAHAAGLLSALKTGSRTLDFLEVMACPQGCMNGGGQPMLTRGNDPESWSRGLQEMEGGPRSADPFAYEQLTKLYQQFAGPAQAEEPLRFLYLDP